MIYLVDMILSNSCAGLIDLNLNLKQKLIEGGSFPYVLKDYSVHTMYARTKQNQSLKEVKELLLGQINEIKRGNFDSWLIDAIISDLKLNQIKKHENNSGVVLVILLIHLFWVTHGKSMLIKSKILPV